MKYKIFIYNEHCELQYPNIQMTLERECYLSSLHILFVSKYYAVILKSPRPLRLKIGLSWTENKITLSTTPIFFQI